MTKLPDEAYDTLPHWRVRQRLACLFLRIAQAAHDTVTGRFRGSVERLDAA